MVDAVIFDMDGVLIDSEPLWRIAEIDVLTPIGVPMTEEMAMSTMGMRTDEVVEHWFRRFPWEGPSLKEIEARIVERVIELIRERGEAKPGVFELIDRLQEKALPIAIASSSASEIIDAVVRQIGLYGRFRVMQSAEHEPYGKPHPGVYIAAARALQVTPSTCLAIEDSANGVLAAKAARMRVVAIPEHAVRGDRRFMIADAVLDSLLDFDLALLDQS